MTPANIASIVIAGISGLVSLGTIAYVSFKTKFQDKQDTQIKITTKTTDTETFAEIVIDLKNDESFGQKMTSFKNGKKEENGGGQNILPSPEGEILFEEDNTPENTIFSTVKDKITGLRKNQDKTSKKKTDKRPASLSQLKEDEEDPSPNKNPIEKPKKIQTIPFLEKLKHSTPSNSFNLNSSFNYTEDQLISPSNNNKVGFLEAAVKSNSRSDELNTVTRESLGKKALYVFMDVTKSMFSNFTKQKDIESRSESKEKRQEGGELPKQTTKFSMKVDDYFGELPRDKGEEELKLEKKEIEKIHYKPIIHSNIINKPNTPPKNDEEEDGDFILLIDNSGTSSHKEPLGDNKEEIHEN
jgi:hypothetical protein